MVGFVLLLLTNLISIIPSSNSQNINTQSTANAIRISNAEIFGEVVGSKSIQDGVFSERDKNITRLTGQTGAILTNALAGNKGIAHANTALDAGTNAVDNNMLQFLLVPTIGAGLSMAANIYSQLNSQPDSVIVEESIDKSQVAVAGMVGATGIMGRSIPLASIIGGTGGAVNEIYQQYDESGYIQNSDKIIVSTVLGGVMGTLGYLSGKLGEKVISIKHSQQLGFENNVINNVGIPKVSYKNQQLSFGATGTSLGLAGEEMLNNFAVENEIYKTSISKFKKLLNVNSLHIVIPRQKANKEKQ